MSTNNTPAEKSRLRAKAILTTAAILFSVLTVATAYSQDAKTNTAPAQTLIRNVRIFDGRSETLAEGINVLVEGNQIAKISKWMQTATPEAKIIDAKGRTVMPQLVDAHSPSDHHEGRENL